jgi:hypothetical protein
MEPTAKPVRTIQSDIVDLLKAIGTVIGIFLAIFAGAFVLELVCILLVKITSPTKPDFTLWPILFAHLAGIIATIFAVQAMRGYHLFNRVLGGGLAGFAGASMVFYNSSWLSNGNVLGGAILGAVCGAAMGKGSANE